MIFEKEWRSFHPFLFIVRVAPFLLLFLSISWWFLIQWVITQDTMIHIHLFCNPFFDGHVFWKDVKLLMLKVGYKNFYGTKKQKILFLQHPPQTKQKIMFNMLLLLMVYPSLLHHKSVKTSCRTRIKSIFLLFWATVLCWMWILWAKHSSKCPISFNVFVFRPLFRYLF